MPQSSTLYGGLDVHQESLAVAYVAKDDDAEVTPRGAIGTRPCDLDALIRKLQAKSRQRVFGDAAGPCGSPGSRDVTKPGHVCYVVAASLLPQQVGGRVNTARRDAIQLARLMRSGDLSPV
jgi:transposase